VSCDGAGRHRIVITAEDEHEPHVIVTVCDLGSRKLSADVTRAVGELLHTALGRRVVTYGDPPEIAANTAGGTQ
jgi:hypothetical protein